jgi:hypothetical protein
LWARNNDATHIETSATTGQGVDVVFDTRALTHVRGGPDQPGPDCDQKRGKVKFC